jgi:hypothetical protein
MRFTLPGGGLIPKPQAPPAPIDRGAIAEEAAKQRAKELRGRRGRASTILTSPANDVGTDAGAVARPTLLGQ